LHPLLQIITPFAHVISGPLIGGVGAAPLAGRFRDFCSCLLLIT